MSNPQKMTMVVARYKENLDWLKKIPWNYIVLNKGDGLPAWVKNEINLQNIGREAHSYLTYIIDNYDNLPDYIVFVQGNPFHHSPELIKKINDFDGETDFFPLSDEILCDDGSGNPSHPGLRIIESAQKIFLENDKVSFEFTPGGQFVVSRKAILFHSKMTYQKLKDFLIKAEPSNKAPTTAEEKECPGYRNLFSPWVMERLWKTLFDNKHKTIYD